MLSYFCSEQSVEDSFTFPVFSLIVRTLEHPVFFKNRNSDKLHVYSKLSKTFTYPKNSNKNSDIVTSNCALVLLWKERQVHMEECAEPVQEILLKMGYRATVDYRTEWQCKY